MANFNTPYTIERDGQIEFFENYGIPYDDDASILVENTDGIYNGCLLEFKLSIGNLNKVLFQAIKYLSRLRIKGESVPATILLVDLNATTVYVYNSRDYHAAIHKIYNGAASKDNEGFIAGTFTEKLDYTDIVGSAQVKKILKGKKKNPDEMYIPIDIDENCIVGWAERYYREKPKASKGAFLGDNTGTAVKVTGEIREPRHFKGLINPYTGKTNEKFKYLMGRLNDRLSRKDLGAFFTPMPYARKAAELVLKAVERVPEGNDYIILDRCAGTGNLEAALIGLTDKNGDDLISHCVVSTYEYYEYKVLQERIGDKVRDIIPPTEANVIYDNGMVANADAMSEEYIDNPIIRQYLDNNKCAIILFENPPYRDAVADNKSRKGLTANKDFIFEEMKKVLPSLPNANISTARDLTNRFIWSGFKYFLRQQTDSYVLFSPIKYWKTLGLANYHFLSGYLLNRHYFDASASAIACILWSNIPDALEQIKIEMFDIENNTVIALGPTKLLKCHKTFEPFFDRSKDPADTETPVYCETNGEQTKGRKCDGTSYTGPEIIAYLRTDSFGIDPKHVSLTRCTLFNIRGFYLRRKTYINLLPLFAAKQFAQDEWYERDVYFSTSDGGSRYTTDSNFLKACLIYTCLSNQNKCLSFSGSDGRLYQNELCFDGGALAFADLQKYAANEKTGLDADEQTLIGLWTKILEEARHTANYNPGFRYGTYQINKELNTYIVTGSGKNKRNIYDYPVLNGDLETLKKLLKEYYKTHLTAKMFEYQLLK